ncbi:MAG: PEP-CTERM sorting domain-containing protein [Planctomycetaceae bacterium]|nr:PEP-CTERM sorting domain-containing protein [Planctomycetaceae bacterium]
MMTRSGAGFILAAICLAVVLCPSTAWADGALGPANIAGQWGEGPDYVGNTSDDTWQYWFENQGVPNSYLALNKYLTYNTTWRGWGLASDWEAWEGLWGDTTGGGMYAHPYIHHGLSESVALTYKVSQTGTYTIAGGVTDMNVLDDGSGGAVNHDGVEARVEILDSSFNLVRTVGSVVVGDNEALGGGAYAPNSSTFSYAAQSLNANQYVRVVIDPRTYAGSDMTRLDYLQVYQGTTAPVAPSPTPNPAPEATQTATYSFNTYPTDSSNLVVLSPRPTSYFGDNYPISSGGAGVHIGLTDVTFSMPKDMTLDKLYFQICDMNTGGRFHMDLYVDGILQSLQTTYVDAIASGAGVLVDLEWDIINLDLLAGQTLMIRFDHDANMVGSSSTAARLNYTPDGNTSYPEVYNVFSSYSRTTPVSLLAVPEPGSLCLMAMGAVSLLLRRSGRLRARAATVSLES